MSIEAGLAAICNQRGRVHRREELRLVLVIRLADKTEERDHERA